MEYDPIYLIYGNTWSSSDKTQIGNSVWPEPLAFHIVAIDSAIALFGKIFPLVSTKRKLQLMNHFLECMKPAKLTPRLNSVIFNKILNNFIKFLNTFVYLDTTQYSWHGLLRNEKYGRDVA